MRDLNRLDVEKLIELQRSVEAELRDRAQTIRRQLHEQLADFSARPRRGTSLLGRKLPPKYRGPRGETWSGRGQHPRWMRPLLRAGRKLESFRI